MNLSINQIKVLKFFQEETTDEECIFFFEYIAEKLNIEKSKARIYCRALAKKGLLSHEVAVDEDCKPCGSGYMLTSQGVYF